MSSAPPDHDVVRRILEGQATRQVRAAAARGALPLPRAALVRLYLFLSGDEEQDIRVDAANSLEALEKPAVMELLADEDCAPEVLEHFATQAVKDEKVAELIAFHRGVPTGALAALAAKGNADVIELVLTNQETTARESGFVEPPVGQPGAACGPARSHSGAAGSRDAGGG